MKKIWILLIAALCALVSSCHRDDKPYEGEYEDVFIYYSLGYNNLSTYLDSNLKDLCSGILPARSREKAIVAFCHSTASSGDYSSPNPPVLIRIAREEGKAVLDTIKVYTEVEIASTAECLNSVLNDIRLLLPSKKYGMLLSSHGTGWIPEKYSEKSSTKSFGGDFGANGKSVAEIDIREMADAFPMKMEYIIFDACLMGGIEVVWEFKDVCKKIICSPTEILAQGMRYKNFSWKLFSGDKPDLQAICEEYIDFYRAQEGQMQSASISLIDCSRLDRLGEVYAGIVQNNRSGFRSIRRDRVQKYFYNSHNWYYDLRDIALEAGASSSEMSLLDSALEESVIYHAETESFFGVRLENCSGLSMYIPDPSRPVLNSYYKTLAWNKQIGLVE